MAELKTKRQKGGVKEFLASIADEQTRKDCEALAGMMRDATKQPGDMWGDSIVGFGQQHLTYASGRELDWFIIGFSPRRANLTIYLAFELDGFKALLAKLGPHTLGKGCLYIKRLADIDADVLKAIIIQAAKPV